ncbi:SusD/RagB family nutrient-binding outer membrane lipoprotein [Flagellimonas sp. S3867]|uniref:SusD/RagB family nutrient-binding outer membrane lipoprotein n=1 Tax=Flagellimonas sp. S3867 TaxID=2768063 RepID=UPI001682B4B9|nr:SusD/RagB family nutrient-binding outer membrane lipoprotein [Flagellimonas sp. S3867]
MKRISKYFSLSVAAFLMLLSCEVSDFDLQENPNFLSPESADPEFLLNEVQYLFQDIMGAMIINTDDIMRYEAMTDSYGDVADVAVLNAEWERFYEALNISRTIEDQASSDSNLLFHNAINKLLLGYLTITMIDYVGSIPYVEAGNPSEFPSPKLDSGVDLYRQVLSDIDQAISDINAATFNVSSDLFYGSDKAKWIAFANSFKLRLLVQARLAGGDLNVGNLQSEINTLLSSNIIDSESEDFVYNHAAVEEPESRHPYFTRGYINGFSQYIGNYFMFMLKDSKSISDPRIRYYLYRQSNEDPFSGPPFLACQGDPEVDFCYVGDQYWGLDHGESRTGRGDNLLRTVYGVYPAGGSFDEDQFQESPDTQNLAGAGFLPILTASYVKFLSAEAALVLGTNGDPASLLEEAIRASMEKVLGFGGVTSTLAATSADVDDYVNEVLANYAAATSDEERLDVIVTEYYLAAFGNSIEAYNAYRRTGYPSNIQIPIDDDNPTFPRSFPYADDAVSTNASISQKQNTVKVFWDTNPDGFIK